MASARRVSALLQPPEPLDIDLEADIFSSSQQLKSGLDVNPSAAYKKGASGAGAAGRGAGASAKGTAAVRGNGGGGGGSKQQASTGAKQAKAKPASGLARWVGSVAAAISAVVKPAAVQGMATGAALGAPGLNTGKAAAYTAPVRGQQKPAVAGSASALVSPTRRPLQPSQGQASGQAGTFAGGRTAATGLAGENADAAAATARGHVAASPGIGLRGAASTSGVSAARSGGTLAALRTRTSPAPAVKALVVSPTAQRWLPAPHTGLTATPAGASRFSAQAGATAVTSPSAGTRSAAKRSRLDVAAEDSGAAAAAKGSRSPMRGSFSFHVPVSAASQLASPTLSGSKAEAQGLRPSPLPRQRSGTTATTAAAVHAAVPVGMQAGPVVRTAAGSAACPPPPIFEGSRLFCGQAQGAAGVRQESSTASEATAARVSKLKRPRQDMPGEGGGAAVVEPRGATSGAAAAASIPAATADPAADPAAADPAAAGTAQGGRSSMTRAGLSASLLQQAMSVATTLTPSAAGVRSSGKGQGGKPSASAHRRKSSLTPGVIAAAAAAAGTPADLQAAPVGRTPCATPKLAAAPKAAAPVPAAATGLLSKGAGGGGAIRVPKLKGGTSGTVTPAATCGAEGGSTPQLLAMAAAKLAQQAPSEAGAGLTPKLGGNAAGAAHRQPQAELAGGVATASATPLEGAGTAGGAFGSAFATPFSVIDLTGPSQDVPASVLNAAAAGVALVATETAVPEAARTRAGSRAGGSAAAAVPTADTQSTRPQQEKMPPEQQQQQLRQLVNVPAPSPSRQRHRTPDGKVRDAEHHGTGPAKVARMAAASAPTGQSPVLTAPEAPASPSSPQAGNAGPAPSGAAPAPSCSLLRGTPGSILRTASRVPPGSQIVGTPMTTPHHFTRQQKEKYSRMGLDLDAMPRCREFVVQDDGTVFVADEPGRGAAQPGPEVEGEACSRRQEAQLEAQPQGVATDAAAGAVHVAAMTLSGKAAAADILPGAAGSSGPAEEQRRRGRKRPAAEAGLDAEGQHHAMTGGLGQGTELAQREAADEDARLAGTSAAESQQGTAADDGGEHASRGPACTGERQGDATLAVDDTGAEAAPKKRRRIEAKAEQGGEAQTTAAAATAVQPSTSGSAIQALKAAGRKGAQGVSIAKQARPTKQAKPVKGSAKGSMAAASGGFRQTTLSPFLRMNGTAAAITASAAAGPVAPSCQETATGQQQVKRQPAGAKVVAAAGPVEANANANGSSAASQPSQSMGNKAGAGAAGPSAQDREASQSQGRDQLPAGSRYRYYLACTALDPDCAESTRVSDMEEVEVCPSLFS